MAGSLKPGSSSPRRACEANRPSCSTIVMALEPVTIVPPVVRSQLAPGTTSWSPPARNPLKVTAPLSPVSPAIDWKRTVLAAESKVSQVGSTRCCWALAGTASERVTNPTSAASVHPTVVGRCDLPDGGAIPSLDIVPHPLIELRFHHTKHGSLIVFFFGLPELCRERMPSSEDDDRDGRTDQAPTEDSDPGELPESHIRE